MVGVNEYLSENVFQWLAHRHTQRLWQERERKETHVDGKETETETAGQNSRSTKKPRLREEKTSVRDRQRGRAME